MLFESQDLTEVSNITRGQIPAGSAFLCPEEGTSSSCPTATCLFHQVE